MQKKWTNAKKVDKCKKSGQMQKKWTTALKSGQLYKKVDNCIKKRTTA
jgi:hypothetical protein